MSGFPQPSRKDHQTFCVTEGWTEVRNARGQKVGHHVTYELVLPDGRILRTRISRPPNRETYGPALWAHILRHQLDVTEADFWECVRNGVNPSRGAVRIPRESIPAGIVSQLIANGVPEVEIGEMSRDEAIARMTEIWSQPR